MREFDTMVEAVRVGTVIAQDADALRKWQQRRTAPKAKPMNDAALEQAILGLARQFPSNVTRVTS